METGHTNIQFETNLRQIDVRCADFIKTYSAKK